MIILHAINPDLIRVKQYDPKVKQTAYFDYKNQCVNLYPILKIQILRRI